MKRIIEDYKNELREMRQNAPYVPYLFAAIAVIMLIASAIN